MDTETKTVEAVTEVERTRIKALKTKVVESLAKQAVPVSMSGLSGALASTGMVFKENTLRNALRQLVRDGLVEAVGGKKNRTYVARAIPSQVVVPSV